MAKILSLRLNYKGRFLDYAKEGKEIRKKFFIGSNKHLQWQILNSSFPDKHLFVKQVGNALVMNIPPGASFTCEKDGKQVDSSFLQKNNLLSGNQLILDPSIAGNVSIHKDWDVDFDFREPWVAVLTHEQRQIVAECATRAKDDPVTKFNRWLMLIATVLTVLFLIFFDLFLKKEVAYYKEIEDLFKGTEAQAITPDLSPQASAQVDIDTPTPEATEGTATGTTEGTQARTGAAGLSGMLGNFDPNATQAPAQYAMVTTIEGFAVKGSGGGSGPGTGGGGAASGGPGTTFSATAGPGFSQDLGAIAASGPATAGHAVKPQGGTGVHITGDASRVTLSGRSWEQSQRDIEIMRDFQSRNIATVSETAIARLDETTQARYTSLGQQVRDRQSQIEAAYRQAQLNQSMSFKVTLYIAPTGNVRSADVVPLGEYPASFVSEVKRIIEGWRFNVQQEMSYQFRFRFDP
jgi:hypothetical protein